MQGGDRGVDMATHHIIRMRMRMQGGHEEPSQHTNAGGTSPRSIGARG